MFLPATGLFSKTIHFQRIFLGFSGYLRSRHNMSCGMKLYSDKGNPNLLRILVAKNLSGQSLDIKYISEEEKQNLSLPGIHTKLPVLELDDGHFLFSPNAICRYFMEGAVNKMTSAEKNAMINHWVEWESAQLQPAILSHVKLKRSNDCGRNLSDTLSQLEAILKKQKHISGDEPGLADVVVWSSLYPLTCQEPQLLGSQFENIKSWNSVISSQEAFIHGIKEGNYSCSSFKEFFKEYSTSLCQETLASEESQRQRVESKSNDQIKSNNQRKSKGTQKSTTAIVIGATEENTGIAITKIQASEDEISTAYGAWVSCKRNYPAAMKVSHPILPIEGKTNVLISSALPYVNNVPHLGNIIGCVLSADVFARYCRLRGYNTLYVCGTDEYGTATETKALEEGLTPKEICDKYFKIHFDVYSWFNIEFDYFGRTTTEQQTQIAQDIFWRLHERDHLLEDTIEQLQCTSCKRFLADRFVEGTCPFCNFEDARGDQCDACGKLINAIELKNPKCKVCGGKPEAKSSKHLFLDLAKLEPTLKTWVEKSSSEGNWTANSRQITRSWIQEGLKPRCITRDLQWGTPVPQEGYTDKVFYVWFDAPIGYLSITANYTDQWEKWWKNPQQVTLYQFMAKDNVPFHTVVFPSTLLGADDNYTLLNNISATEYLNYEDDKFSKSRGVGVFGNNAVECGIPADIWRFYLLYMRPEGQDSNFSWSDFVIKNNSELLNNLGNFINRALMFLNNNFNGVVPEMDLQDEDKNFIALVNRELKSFLDNMEKIRLREGLKVVLNISKYGNQYVQANKPWVLMKGNDNERRRAGTVIGLASNLSFLLSVLIHPYMPKISAEIRSQVQVGNDLNVLSEHFIPMLKPGHKIGQPKPLFQKIEPSLADEFRKKYAGQKKVAVANKKPRTSPSSLTLVANGNQDIEKLQNEVTAQGDKVRNLKANKAEKAIIDTEVTHLLDLKKQLALAQGKDPMESTASTKNKKKSQKK